MQSTAPPVTHVAATRWSLLMTHRDRILRLARSRLADAQEAEDCVQEALLRAATFRNLDENRIGPFLTTVTLRLCTDVHRRDERHRRLLRATWMQQAAGPEEQICAAYEEAWVLRQVERLAGREQEVILARVNGISTREFASRLGISDKAAESAFTRARARLRRWYEESLTG
ncbi:RNA polymerase sigma factor [Streptomyces sp. NPDC087901]|uniref:RNA polymerase sigma factor n=1 Tax=unclassified Streptomyces TaxID=2593676 RepID=UPI00343CE1A4